MRVRDHFAAAYGSIFILSGLRPEVLDRVPAAFRDVVCAPDAARLRRRVQPSTGSRTIAVDVARHLAVSNVHRADAALSDSALFGHHHRLGYDELPVSLVLAGDRLSIKTWHGELDGTVTVEILHWLIDLACGLPDTPWSRPVSFPVLRGAVRARAPLAVRAALEFRRGHSTPVLEAPSPTAAQDERRDVALTTTRLDARTIDRVREAGAGITTVNSALVAVVAATVARIYRDAADPVVMTPVHLERWAGGRVDGNFLLNLRLGGLRSTSWSPESVQRLVSVMQSRVGFGSYLWELQWPLKSWLRRRSSHVAARPELTVQVSAVRSPRPFPAAAWITDHPTAAFGSVGPFPACFTMLWRVDGAVLLSFQDETGRFDTTRFLPELERRLAERIDAADGPPLASAAGSHR